MKHRIIEITTQGTTLSIDTARLRVTEKNTPPLSVPLDDIGAVLISNPATFMSSSVISSLAAHGICIIHCGQKHTPVATTFPMADGLSVCDLQEQQYALKLPIRKQLWRQLVQRKILNSAPLLAFLSGSTCGIEKYAARVRSGDPDNIEAQAAVIFWRHVPFIGKRDREAEDANRLFNYAYTVLYASTARAICGASLNPHVGIHHRGRSNPFCLASDIMEPYRFLGDIAVTNAIHALGTDELTPAVKRAIVASLHDTEFPLSGEWHTLHNALALTVASVKNTLLTGKTHLVLPECPPLL
jgi:CRISPR-associated protein Cas1